MKVQVIETTDKKHKNEIYEIPAVTKEVMRSFGMDAHTIMWNNDICTVQSSNYTIKLKKIGD